MVKDDGSDGGGVDEDAIVAEERLYKSENSKTPPRRQLHLRQLLCVTDGEVSRWHRKMLEQA